MCKIIKKAVKHKIILGKYLFYPIKVGEYAEK